MMACMRSLSIFSYGGYGTATEDEDLETCRHAVDKFPVFSAIANDLFRINWLDALAGTIGCRMIELLFWQLPWNDPVFFTEKG